MGYREVRMVEVKEVVRLWLAAVPKKRIAAMLGLDRKTVRRYIGLAAAEGVHASAQAGSALTELRHTIHGGGRSKSPTAWRQTLESIGVSHPPEGFDRAGRSACTLEDLEPRPPCAISNSRSARCSGLRS